MIERDDEDLEGVDASPSSSSSSSSEATRIVVEDLFRRHVVGASASLSSSTSSFASAGGASEYALGCALLLAASEGDADACREIASAWPRSSGGGGGGATSFRNHDGRTALHAAAAAGRLGAAEFLVAELGAGVDATDRWGATPLDDANRGGHGDVADFLVESGAALLPPARGGGKDRPLQLRQQGGGAAASPGGDDNDTAALLDLMHQYGSVRGGELTMDFDEVRDLLRGVGNSDLLDGGAPSSSGGSDLRAQKIFAAADVDGNGLIDSSEFLASSDMFLSGRPARIILVVGGPGSGKGLLSQRLVREAGVVHLSSGHLLRAEVAKGTALGRHVEGIMKRGELVSSAVLVSLMQRQMKDHPGKRVLLDGFPRSQENARDLVTLCGKPELALHLDCDDTVLMERIMKRSKEGNSGRDDDNFETAIQRIRNYHRYHDMTMDFLKAESVPIVNLDCSTTPDGVWEQLRGIGRLMRPTVRIETAN